MQYILTEEEYSELKSNISSLNQQIAILKNDYRNLQEKYNKLLVFGVSSLNEQLKQQKVNSSK